MISSMINAAYQEKIIIACSIIAILFGVLNAWQVLRINVTSAVDAEG